MTVVLSESRFSEKSAYLSDKRDFHDIAIFFNYGHFSVLKLVQAEVHRLCTPIHHTAFLKHPDSFSELREARYGAPMLLQRSNLIGKTELETTDSRSSGSHSRRFARESASF